MPPALKGMYIRGKMPAHGRWCSWAPLEALRPVQIEGTKTAIGAGAGAAVGGIAGSGVGSVNGGYVTAVIGAVAGGLQGAAAEEGLTRTQGVEITVKEDGGATRAYVQEVSEGEIFRVGDRAAIMKVDGKSRVAHAQRLLAYDSFKQTPYCRPFIETVTVL